MNLEEENKKLKERITFLENIINRGSAGNTSAYNAVRLAIVEKVDKEADFSHYEEWQRKHKRKVLEMNIMRDLKWDLHIRNIADFRIEHIEPAKEYIANYKI